MEMMDWTIFAHYPTNIEVLILEIDFLIDLIFELYCIIFVFSDYLLVSVPIQINWLVVVTNFATIVANLEVKWLQH